jgi:hypothetical protein
MHDWDIQYRKNKNLVYQPGLFTMHGRRHGESLFHWGFFNPSVPPPHVGVGLVISQTIGFLLARLRKIDPKRAH